ncbi:acyl-CoA dehydrogenase family protein [Saccharopolyspora sp. HNM0983]|uniref:Acyl-CoA dehydrogenase family protein n=1 Tax=Saccharopolyspora montiporae TaxID=2781240 RepID=A0A929B926_9PSEU|nr:acyl-CoA dehydrogenase family protein [Saccharopolyspora sp. HNM0983]
MVTATVGTAPSTGASASTDEQAELRTVTRRFLAERSPSGSVRRWMDSAQGHDPALWRQLTGQLGLAGVAVPERFGGAGGGPVELGIVLEEMGRALVPSPFFATAALAGQALTASGDGASWLPAVAAGSLTATLAVAEGSGSWRPADIATVASPSGDGWSLSGTKMFVVDGDSAALLLVVARTDTGPALFAVTGDTGVQRTRLDALDPTRRLARIDLDGVPAVRIGSDDDAAPLLRQVLDLAVVALAAEQVGGAQACLRSAVDHAQVREQFGRPIGAFQAIKHRCADLLVEVEAARSAVAYAASVATDPAERPVAAALAAAYCSRAYTHVAKENIQIHGGVGYTWEHDAHLHLKRAKSSELLFGAPTTHRARLADLVGIGSGAEEDR